MNLLGQRVKHRTLGSGTVVFQDDKYISVEFGSKTSKFQYPHPDTFVKFLSAADKCVQESILQEQAEQKRIEDENRAAAEESKRKAEDVRLEAEAVARRSGGGMSSGKTVAARQAREPGKPLTFYVFQGDTFNIESRGGFIWAPQLGYSGNRVFHWENMKLVKIGDIILHGCLRLL